MQPWHSVVIDETSANEVGACVARSTGALVAHFAGARKRLQNCGRAARCYTRSVTNERGTRSSGLGWGGSVVVGDDARAVHAGSFFPIDFSAISVVAADAAVVAVRVAAMDQGAMAGDETAAEAAGAT